MFLNRKGFFTSDLVVATTVIFLLALVAIPSFRKAMQKVKAREALLSIQVNR